MDSHEAEEAFWLPRSEDDALLGTLLRFIDDNASDLHVTLAGDGPARANERRRKRPGDKIEELREEANRLEATIQCLQSQEEMKAIVSDIRWAMVSGQRSQRQKAEAEKERLHQLIQEQSDLIQQLEHLLADRAVRVKRTLGVKAHCSESMSSFQKMVVYSTQALESVTSALVPMSLQTEWVLANAELKAAGLVSNGYCAIFKKLQGVERPALHVTDSRVVPFNLEVTSAAVWGNLVYRLGSFHGAGTPSSDVLRTQHTEVVEIPGFRGVVGITMALQRFEDEDRVVFVRRAVFTYLDPDGRNSHVVFPGLTVQHSLWTIVQRLRFKTSPVSRIQTLGISIPAFLPNTETHTKAIDRFLTDMSLQFGEFTNEDVDNRLLRGKGTSPYPSVAMFENVT